VTKVESIIDNNDLDHKGILKNSEISKLITLKLEEFKIKSPEEIFTCKF